MSTKKRIDYKDLVFSQTNAFVNCFGPDPVTPVGPETAYVVVTEPKQSSLSVAGQPGVVADPNAVSSEPVVTVIPVLTAEPEAVKDVKEVNPDVKEVNPEVKETTETKPIDPATLDSKTRARAFTFSDDGPKKIVFDPVAARRVRMVKALFTYTVPESLPNPVLVAISPFCALLLEVDPNSLRSPWNLPLLAGTGLHNNATPFSQNYGGHQYGIYAGQLGDGRCVTLGQTSAQEKTWEVNLKGIGPTCYSRGGDGYCSLRTCMIEFLVSEYLAMIDVPTTRSLAVVVTSKAVHRGMHIEPGAVLTRISPTWIRFGTFELLFYREDHDQLKALADYTIDKFYKEAIENEDLQTLNTKTLMVNPSKIPSDIENNETESITIPLNRYAVFFRMVVKKTAIMVAHWQANGFVHGALSTVFTIDDRITCLFLASLFTTVLVYSFVIIGFHGSIRSGMDTQFEWYSHNTIDMDQQYRFEAQPTSAQWNLSRLGRTLVELIGEPWVPFPKKPEGKPNLGTGEVDHPLDPKKGPSFPSKQKIPLGFVFNSTNGENIVRELVKEFEGYFIESLTEVMCRKLGLVQKRDTDFDRLIIPLLEMMADTGVDYSLFFRLLCTFKCLDGPFIAQTTYDPAVKHDPNVLLNSDPTDCFGLLLKSVAKLIKDEEDFKLNNPWFVPQSLSLAAAMEEPEELPIVQEKASLVKARGTSGSSMNMAQSSTVDLNRNSSMTGSQMLKTKTSAASLRGLAREDSFGSQPINPKSERNTSAHDRIKSAREKSERIASANSKSNEKSDRIPSANSQNEKLDRIPSAHERIPSAKKTTSMSTLLLSSIEKASLTSVAVAATTAAQNAKEPRRAKPPTGPTKEEREAAEGVYNEAHRLPTLVETANQWKYWAQTYRSRLLNELPLTKRTAAGGLETEETIRCDRMKKLNPKYLLRGWIMRDLLAKLGNTYIPVDDTKVKTPAKSKKKQGVSIVAPSGDEKGPLSANPTTKPDETPIEQSKVEKDPKKVGLSLAIPTGTDPSPDSAAPRSAYPQPMRMPMTASTDGPKTDTTENRDVLKLVKVLLRDIWGELSDSKDGLGSEDLNQLAQRWSKEPPPHSNNLMYRLNT